MNAPALGSGHSFRLDLSARGYQVLFHVDEANRCPGCGHSQWYVGRVTAECAVCGTALPLAHSELAGLNPLGRRAVALHVLDDAGQAKPVSDQRRSPRRPGRGGVIGLHVDGSPRAFAVQNYSEGGLMGSEGADLAGARTLFVEFDDGSLRPAELRWSDGVHAGLAYLTSA